MGLRSRIDMPLAKALVCGMVYNTINRYILLARKNKYKTVLPLTVLKKEVDMGLIVS